MDRAHMVPIVALTLSLALGCSEPIEVSGGGGFGGGRAGAGGFAFDAGVTPHRWRSPLQPMGVDGWRDSQEALCGWTATVGTTDVDLWSDARGVFALVSGGPYHDDYDAGDDALGDCTAGCVALNVHHNDGSGWRVYSTGTTAASASQRPRLTGAVEGPLFVQQANLPSACTVYTVSDRSTTCIATYPMTPPFVVDATRAYAIRTNATLMTFDGHTWADTRTLPLDVTALWADAFDVLVARPASLNRLTPSGWEEELLPFASISAVWGKARTDLWVGTTLGEVWHFDGAGWQRITTLGGVTCNAVDAVRGIWGSGNVVYVHGAHSLLRWDGAAIEDLANWSCGFGDVEISIEALWGNADDVFIALRDMAADSPCDNVAIVRYDGTEFHRM